MQHPQRIHKKTGELLSLSQQHKAKRDAAIMEQHAKGLSARKIAAMFGMGKTTVTEVIAQLAENAESANPATPNETTAVPLASTERGTETLRPHEG